MKKQAAMSTTLQDCKLEPLSDLELEEWLLFKDNTRERNGNSPSLELTRCETAEQVLQDIEDLGKRENEYWLEEFPLFEEIQTLTPFEESKLQLQDKIHDISSKQSQGAVIVNDSWCGSDFYELPPQFFPLPNLFGTSLENSLNIQDILPSDSILYIDTCSPSPISEPERFKTYNDLQSTSSESEGEKSPDPELVHKTPKEDKSEMDEVDEIIRNTAMELDQWESDSSRSEISSIGASEPSPKMREDDCSDPEWRPEEPSKPSGSRKYQNKRSKPYWRGGTQEDKKLRKKEQNKNAATRYRQKKKAEVSEILREEEELKEKKTKLEERVADIQNEIKCLKGLMRDLFRAKGLID